MTSQSPRIYLYKITFEEVPYYYYGVHKEKYFNDDYWGSPKTNKWCWELYTPKKQILEFFDYNGDGWMKSQEVEKRLIKPFFNTDKWCLNESCGGNFSLEQKSKAGKMGGKISGKKSKENKTGVCGRSKEQMSKDGRRGGQKIKELGIGIFGLTKEEIIEHSSKVGKLTYELGVGIHGRTKEKMIEDGRKAAKVINSQKWMCLETGVVSTFGPLTRYQRKRNIDTSKRVRVL
jgi:hypothetical protein